MDDGKRSDEERPTNNTMNDNHPHFHPTGQECDDDNSASDEDFADAMDCHDSDNDNMEGGEYEDNMHCKAEGCFSQPAKRSPYCKLHQGTRYCQHPGCNKCAQVRFHSCAHRMLCYRYLGCV